MRENHKYTNMIERQVYYLEELVGVLDDSQLVDVVLAVKRRFDLQPGHTDAVSVGGVQNVKK